MNDEDGATVVELADRLWRAEVDRTPIEPITETRPDLTIADAYAIQAYNIRAARRRRTCDQGLEGRTDLAAQTGHTRRHRA